MNMKEQELIRKILNDEKLQKIINNESQDGVNASILRHNEWSADLVISLYRLFYKSGMDWLFVGNIKFFDYCLSQIELFIDTTQKLFKMKVYRGISDNMIRCEVWNINEDRDENGRDFFIQNIKRQELVVNSYNNVIDGIETLIKTKIKNFTI